MRNVFYVYVFVCAGSTEKTDLGNVNSTNILVAIFRGLVGLMILSFCYIICKYNTF